MFAINSQEQFDELVKKRMNTTKKTRDPSQATSNYANLNMWVVEFFVDWAETCVYVSYSFL